MTLDHTQLDPRARGQAIRQARARRTRMIRRRVVGGAAAVFSAAWLAITVVLVSGHDPALSKTTAAANRTATASSTKTVTTASSPTTAATPATPTATTASVPASSSAVTTRQS